MSQARGEILIAYYDPDRDVSNTFQKQLRRYTRDARPAALRREAGEWRAEAQAMRALADQVRHASRASSLTTSTLASAEFEEACARMARDAETDADRAEIAARALERSADSLEQAKAGEQALSDQRQSHPHPGPQPPPSAPVSEQVQWQERFNAYEEKRLRRESRAEVWVSEVNQANAEASDQLQTVHERHIEHHVDWDEVRRRELERLDDEFRHATDPHGQPGHHAGPDSSPGHPSTSYTGSTQAGAHDPGAAPSAHAPTTGGTSTTFPAGPGSLGAGAVAGGAAGAAGAAALAAGRGAAPGSAVVSPGAAGGRTTGTATGGAGARGTGARGGPARGGAAVAGSAGTNGSRGAGGARRGGGATGAIGATSAQRRRGDEEDPDEARSRLLLEESWLDDEQGGPATLGR